MYYVDTNIFLNIIYKEARVYEKSRKFLEEIHNGNITALTSSVTLLELKLDLVEGGYQEIAEKTVSLVEEIKKPRDNPARQDNDKTSRRPCFKR